MALKCYRDLEVWKKAMDLAELVYLIANELPKEERFGLTSQVQRAAISIPSNIAEGYGRSNRGEYLHSLSFAKGSLCELETQLVLAVRLGYISRDRAKPAWRLCQEVGKMLGRLMKSLKKLSSAESTALVRKDERNRTQTLNPRP
jgi:four helix bundle protein